MNATQLTALIGAIVALVTAVGGIIALFRHNSNTSAHK